MEHLPYLSIFSLGFSLTVAACLYCHSISIIEAEVNMMKNRIRNFDTATNFNIGADLYQKNLIDRIKKDMKIFENKAKNDETLEIYNKLLSVVEILNKHNEKLDQNYIAESQVSPLESFEVIIENSTKIFSDISINIFFIFFFIIFFFSYFNNKSIKRNIILIRILTFFFDFFFKNFKNLVSNIRYERYFFLMLTVLVFIVFENLGSFYLLELPFNSHAVITLFLSFILFFNYVINFLINFNETSYKKFIQKDINIFIIIFLFFIELISFLIRPLSLGVRLFANILSGHIPVHIFFTAFIFVFKFIF